MPAAQIYVSECSTPSIRGLLSSLPAMFMAFGISVTYAIGAFVPFDILSGFCGIASLVGFICIVYFPESPAWLKVKGLEDQAQKSADWLNIKGKNVPEKIKVFLYKE